MMTQSYISILHSFIFFNVDYALSFFDPATAMISCCLNCCNSLFILIVKRDRR